MQQGSPRRIVRDDVFPHGIILIIVLHPYGVPVVDKVEPLSAAMRSLMAVLWSQVASAWTSIVGATWVFAPWAILAAYPQTFEVQHHGNPVLPQPSGQLPRYEGRSVSSLAAFNDDRARPDCNSDSIVIEKHVFISYRAPFASLFQRIYSQSQSFSHCSLTSPWISRPEAVASKLATPIVHIVTMGVEAIK